MQDQVRKSEGFLDIVSEVSGTVIQLQPGGD